MSQKSPQKFAQERRQKPRRQDWLYQAVVTLNILAWVALGSCLIIFHLARPEMVTGVQQFWGIESRTTWSQEYIDILTMLLQTCLGLSLLTMILRARRTRRREDNYGVNLFILAGITAASLVTLTTTLS